MKKWQSLLANGYRSIESLQDIFAFSEDEAAQLKVIQEQYPVFLNPYYLSLIDRSDPNDPIRKMSIPIFYYLFESFICYIFAYISQLSIIFLIQLSINDI